MANFWSGFNQGFQPYGTRAADLISRTILNNKARDKDFYNQLALQDNKGKNALDVQRQKLFAEQEKIKKEKEYNLAQQKTYEEILKDPESNQDKIQTLDDKYQIKLNRTLELQREFGDMSLPDEVKESEYVRSEDVPGLGVKGKKVLKTTTRRGDKVSSTNYGRIVNPEDFERKGDQEPKLSKEEQTIIKDIDTNFKVFAKDLMEIEKYGNIKQGDEVYTKEEYIKKMNRDISYDTEMIKSQLKRHNSLGLYNEIYNKYRNPKNGGKDLNQMDAMEKLSYFEDYVQEIEEAYAENKISSEDLKLYEYLFTLDSKKNLAQFKKELAQYKGMK